MVRNYRRYDHAMLMVTGLNAQSRCTDGSYKLIQLRPGVYNIKASPRTLREEKNDLRQLPRRMYNQFMLKLRGQREAVSAADTARVDTTRTIVGGTVTTREVDSLPNNSRSPRIDFHARRRQRRSAFNSRPANDRTSSGTTRRKLEFSLPGRPHTNNIAIDGLDNDDTRRASDLRLAGSGRRSSIDPQSVCGRVRSGIRRLANLRPQRRCTFHGRGFYFFA